MNITRPEDVGFSGERLARINAVMQRYVDEQKVAGIVTLVARRNRVVHLEKFGMADSEVGKPMQDDTLFRIDDQTHYQHGRVDAP